MASIACKKCTREKSTIFLHFVQKSRKKTWPDPELDPAGIKVTPTQP